MKLEKLMMCVRCLLGLWILVLGTTAVNGQRFGAGFVAGFNASQIDGDDLAGFDRVGLTAGIRATMDLESILDFNVEFLYSERGSRPDLFQPEYDPDISIKLQYAEIPVYVSINDWWQEEEEYYKVSAHLGFSYGRLFTARTFDRVNPDDQNYDLLVPYFNENDVSWLAGVSFRMDPRWTITGRYTRGITPLLNPEKHNLAFRRLLSYYLTFRLEYTFK